VWRVSIMYLAMDSSFLSDLGAPSARSHCFQHIDLMIRSAPVVAYAQPARSFDKCAPRRGTRVPSCSSPIRCGDSMSSKRRSIRRWMLVRHSAQSCRGRGGLSNVAAWQIRMLSSRRTHRRDGTVWQTESRLCQGSAVPSLQVNETAHLTYTRCQESPIARPILWFP
jgi:hypothetical protein